MFERRKPLSPHEYKTYGKRCALCLMQHSIANIQQHRKIGLKNTSKIVCINRFPIHAHTSISLGARSASSSKYRVKNYTETTEHQYNKFNFRRFRVSSFSHFSSSDENANSVAYHASTKTKIEFRITTTFASMVLWMNGNNDKNSNRKKKNHMIQCTQANASLQR